MAGHGSLHCADGPGHPRPACSDFKRTWMPGTRPGMTMWRDTEQKTRPVARARFSQSLNFRGLVRRICELRHRLQLILGRVVHGVIEIPGIWLRRDDRGRRSVGGRRTRGRGRRRPGASSVRHVGCAGVYYRLLDELDLVARYRAQMFADAQEAAEADHPRLAVSSL